MQSLIPPSLFPFVMHALTNLFARASRFFQVRSIGLSTKPAAVAWQNHNPLSGTALAWISTALISLALSGCAIGGKTTQDISLGKRFSVDAVPSGKCRVVICWPSDVRNASGIQPTILLQGVDVGVLKPLGFLDAVVEPGDISIAAKYEDIRYDHTFHSETNLQAAADSEVYVIYDPAPRAKYSVLTLGVPSISFAMNLHQVPMVEGRELALHTRRSNPN